MILKKKILIGALTSKPYSFSARSWELKSLNTIDLFDSLCSNIKVDMKGTKIMRILPANNNDLNQEWISDKIRFGTDGLNRWRFISPMKKVNNQFINSTWEDIIEDIYNEFKKESYNSIFINTGIFSDLENITSLKNFSSKLDKVILEKSIVCFDWQENYLLNENFENVSGNKIILIVGLNLKLENPILNIKLKELSKKKNILIGYIGSHYNENVKMINLGNNLKVFKNIVEGKHWFCSHINNFLLKNDKNFKIKNSLKNNISIIYGKDFLSNKNSKNIYSYIKKLKRNNIKFKQNTLLPYSGNINTLELGFNSIIKIAPKNNSLFYLNGTDFNKYVTEKDFVIFQGHHNNLMRSNIDLILPTVNWFEKTSLYLNCYGVVQKSQFLLTPPRKARVDWKIIEVLDIYVSEYINRKVIHINVDMIHSKMNKLSPNIKDNLNKFNNKFDSLKLQDKNKNNKKFILYNNLIKSRYNNYYTLNDIDKSSKIMKQCSENFKIYRNNYTNLNI